MTTSSHILRTVALSSLNAEKKSGGSSSKFVVRHVFVKRLDFTHKMNSIGFKCTAYAEKEDLYFAKKI